jgi:hypothetical protein
MIPDNIPVPNFDINRQYLGAPEMDKDSVWFFPIINYTHDELTLIEEQKILNRRKMILEEKSQEIAMKEIQSITDPMELQKVKESFPLWDPKREYTDPNQKVIRIMPDGSIELFELIGKPSKGTKPEELKSGWNKIT